MNEAEIPPLADLKLVAASLDGDARFEKLNAMIRSASVAQSCHSDLAEAAHTIEALEELLKSPRKKGSTVRSTTECALQFNAISLYTRATATAAKHGERGAIQVRGKLSPLAQIDHDIVVGARNRAIAHVYSEEAIGERIWHRDHLLVQKFDDGWVPLGYTNRVQVDRNMINRLTTLVPVAREIVNAAFQKRVKAIMNLMNDNVVPEAVFQAARVDPLLFYGSREEAMRAAHGRHLGQVHGFARGLSLRE
ncbi:hypothetical protein MRBLMC3_001276 [Sphingobium sp. LMC3-1-1.1]|uniref:hypothetical protein n=1 Tax=Sphingobium sp. LMC3-1-1.1 TaxID=3135241 RepID=UPI00343D95B4